MVSGSIKIYSSENTPRLSYIAGIVLGDILGLRWEVTTDKRKLGKHPVINYSKENISGSFKISPDNLLFEKGVEPRNITVTEWKGLQTFFPASTDSDIPFDIFAASFFMVSRYEEYLEFKPDIYNRYPAALSIASRYGFLEKPIVDLWARELAKAFLKKFQTLVFRRNEYKAVLTIDTDQPFAYKGKNIIRSIGSLIHDKNTGQMNVGERYRIIATSEKDPFDVFDFIIDTIEKIKTDTRFFFPVGDHSKYDKNPSWKNEEYRSLINKMAERYKTGLHPSFKAGGDGSLINVETARLKSILGREISMSRFHYIHIRMPHSYKSTLGAGIAEDYSMGYPDECGFRAGIARSYNFFNITEDRETNLRIIPFQVMDGTLYDYKKLDPEHSKALILKLINETRRVGGTFVSIWHNTSLLDNEDRREWRGVFEFMIKNQQP